jgi:hypothetical protein
MLIRIEDLDLDSFKFNIYSYFTLIKVIDPLKSNIYINININSLKTNSLEKKGAIEVS